MNVNGIFDSLFVTVMKYYRIYCANSNYHHYIKLLKKHNLTCRKLSKEQKRAIDSVWKGCGKYNYKTHQLIYSVTGKFDPKCVPEKLFRTRFELSLNAPLLKYGWSDKSYFSFWFDKNLFPENIVMNINGVFYNENYTVIAKEEAVKLIKSHNKFIIKPSMDSGCGKGVSLVNTCKDSEIEDILSKYGKDYVIQTLFEQHNTLSEFNPSSVNVIRFVSIFVNGKVYPVMGALRCGAEGAISDNSITKDGLGMFVIGIDENGILKDEAYYSCGKRITRCPNGTEFKGKAIPNYDKMKDIICQYHSKMAHFGFIAWDFVVDKNGEPKIMEYNIKGPGVLYYQYANGPLFGEYTDMMIDYIKKNNKK